MKKILSSALSGAVSEHVPHPHPHLRMDKNFWQREKGATCTLVCS